MTSGKEDLSIISLSEEPRADSLDPDAEKDDVLSTIPAKYRGTAHDKKDMSVMGKKQVLRVCRYIFDKAFFPSD